MDISFIKAVEKGFSHQENQLKPREVWFCEVFEWTVEQSSPDVCTVLPVWLGRMVGPGEAGEEVMSSIWSFVCARLQMFYNLRPLVKWSHSAVLLRSRCGTFKEELLQKECLTGFSPGARTTSHPHESGEKGTSWGFFKESVQEFFSVCYGGFENLGTAPVEYLCFRHPSRLWQC